MSKALIVKICEAVAEAMRLSDSRPGSTLVEMDYAPDFTIPETKNGRIVVCPGGLAVEEFTRDGVSSREAKVEIGYFRQAEKHEVPEHLLIVEQIAQSFEYKKLTVESGISATCFEAEHSLLYDVDALLEDGIFRSVVTLYLTVES